MKRQLDPLHIKYKDALKKKDATHQIVAALEDEISGIQNQAININSDNHVSVKLADFIEFQNFKVQKNH
jgi:hypothetical protein